MTRRAGTPRDSRRDWLASCSRAAVGASAASLTIPLAQFITPTVTQDSDSISGSSVVCRDLELPPNQARTVALQGHPVIVLKRSDGSLRAFSARCTHLGCTVGFDSEHQNLHCACHGARFNPDDGTATEGPAVRPLQPIPVQLRHDRIVVGS